MTEEEADALDEEITNTDITLKPGEGGIFTRQRKLLDALDRASEITQRCQAPNSRAWTTPSMDSLK
jgi:hypothetical protein